jgi:hypothetical protein
MQYKRAILVLIIIVLQLTACARNPDTPEKIEPARVEPLEEGISRVVLTEKAADRLDIQTAPVRDELVVRKRTVGGEVVALPDENLNNPYNILVRVPLNESDLNKVDTNQPALVLPLTGTEDTTSLPALPVKAPTLSNPDEATGALFYRIDSNEHGLVPGQIVLIELPLSGSGDQRKVIPYAADGPSAGTDVATVGVAELFGTEFGVGK